MTLKQRISAALAGGFLAACALIPLSVSNETAAPQAQAAGLYSCIVKPAVAPFGAPPHLLIVSSRTTCIGAYGSPKMKVTMRVWVNGRPYKTFDPVIISARSTMPWSITTHADDIRYLRCSKVTVFSDVYTYTTNAQQDTGAATIYTNC